MSLIPTRNFPGDLFLEARLLGQPVTAICQIGFSVDTSEYSVAVFSRASSVLLVAGVGSYCAYRICTKYLGRRFVWMLLDSARFDSLASADRRLLYASGLSDDESDCYEEIEDDGDVESCDEIVDYKRNHFFLSRTNSEISLRRSSRKSRGLFAIQQSKSGPDGVLRRQNASDRSNRSHNPACSSSLSNRSASLRIIWEGQQNWDDEFAVTEETQHRPSIISRTPLSQQKIAPSTSAGDLGSVFDDILSLSSALDQSEEVPYEDVTECDDTFHNNIMRLKCMTDSKYMYQSVVVPSSEMGSDNGGSVTSTKSNLKELSKQLTRTTDRKGLWDLSHETPSTSHLKPPRCEMTDSGFSRSTHSKRSHEHRSMFDSAIGCEIFSSEDESNDQIDRRVLNPLRESDSSSHLSLEWCDEGLRQRESLSGSTSRLELRNIDLGYDLNRGSLARSSRSSPFNVCLMYRPKDSRDLMVFACEKFLPYSSQFKIIQQLYHRQRFRRIGPSPKTAEETLKLFMASALYHGYNILRKSPAVIEKNFESCVIECNFLHRWKGTTIERMRENLRSLLNMKKMPSSMLGESEVRGVALLLVLSARDVYDGKLAGDRNCSWFSLDSPAEVMLRIEQNLPLDETCWRLLGNFCDVSVKIFDFSATELRTLHFGNSQNIIYYLRLSPSLSPQPLFYVPDD